MDHLHRPALAVAALALRGGSGAADPDHLSSPGEVDPGRSVCGLEGASRPPPVTGLNARDGRDVPPGQVPQDAVQGLLARLDRQKVVAASADDPLSDLKLSAHRVSGDHLFLRRIERPPADADRGATR